MCKCGKGLFCECFKPEEHTKYIEYGFYLGVNRCQKIAKDHPTLVSLFEQLKEKYGK